MVKQLKDTLNLQLHRRQKDWFVILCDKEPLPSVAVHKKLVYVGQAHRQVLLGEGVIQQGDGPNNYQKWKPLGGWGGMLFWKLGCLRLNFINFEGSMIWKQVADTGLSKRFRVAGVVKTVGGTGGRRPP